MDCTDNGGLKNDKQEEDAPTGTETVLSVFAQVCH